MFFPPTPRDRQVARHCNRLFPASLAGASDPEASAVLLRERFSVLRGKIERKRLACQLELKMRALYYDAIDPSAVEGYITSIYRQVRVFVCISICRAMDGWIDMIGGVIRARVK